MGQTKPLKEMTPEERREYNRIKAQERSARWEAERAEEQRLRQARCEAFWGKWEKVEERIKSLEAPAQAAPIAEAVAGEARRVLLLWDAAERSASLITDATSHEVSESVRLAVGMKPAEYKKIVAALSNVGALVPNTHSEYIEERLQTELIDGGESFPITVRDLTRAVIEDSGWRVNEGVMDLLRARTIETQEAATDGC